MRGELVSSVSSKYDDNSAIVGTNKVYAAIHQFGGKAGRNKKVEVSARPYLKLENSDLNDIKTSVQKYLQE
jgi:phage virion morphogenesis protein